MPLHLLALLVMAVLDGRAVVACVFPQAIALLAVVAVFAVMLPTSPDYNLYGLSGVSATIRGGLQMSFSDSVGSHVRRGLV